MNQHDFDILLQKYLSGRCDPQEEKLILEWSETVYSTSKVELSREEQKCTERKIWKRIKGAVLIKDLPLGKIRWMVMTIAAAIVLLICGLAVINQDIFSFYNINSKNKTTRADLGLTIIKDYIEIKNASGRNQALSLEDGTIVILTKESSLKYPRHFTSRTRRVELVGEAFFTVKKDASKPFFVYAGEIVTQVLGTSFNVKSYLNSNTIEVRVVTGRVSVFENKQRAPQNRNGVILRPNQKITFDKESRKLIPELVEAPVMVESPDKKFELVFTESALVDVLSALQQAYDIEIVVENPDLNHCIFTGDLSGLPLHTQLRFICKTLNSSYELRGTTIFISGNGCSKSLLKQ